MVMNSKPIGDNLINLAWEVVNLKGKDKQIYFGDGTDYQCDLHICWSDNKFMVWITVYSEPYTTGGFFYDPPETEWREQTDEFAAIKISDIADWLERDWGFNIVPPTTPPNKALYGDPKSVGSDSTSPCVSE